MMDGVSRTEGQKPVGPKPLDRTAQDKLERSREDAPGKVKHGGRDSAKISVDAAEISRYQEMARMHREAYGPADRTEKLEEVRQRVLEGFYDRPDVLERVADKVVGESAPGQVKARDADEIHRRAEGGYYDRDDVVDRTAENVLRQVMPRQGGEGDQR